MTERAIVASDIANTQFDHPGYKVGRWYIPEYPGTISSSAVAPGASSIRLVPGYIKKQLTLNSLGMRVTILSASGNVQAAIYANDPSNFVPTGLPLASTASMSTSATGSVNSAASLQLGPGVYWFASNCDNGTAAFAAMNVGNAYLAYLLGSTNQGNDLFSGQSFAGYAITQSFNTWPDLTSASLTEVTAATVPMIQFKVASVP